MTKLDVVLLYLLGSVFLTVTVYSIIKNFVLSLFIAFLLLVFFRALFLHFYRRKKNKSVISVADMETELAILGSDQVDYFLSVIPNYYNPVKTDGGIIITNKDKIFIATNYRFSPTGADDVARFYRLAKKEKTDVVWILGRYPARQTITFASSLDILFRFVRSKKVHTFLKTRNALMAKRRVVRTRNRPRLRTIFSEVFTQKRAKYFALSGMSLSVFALFGVMRVYYFVLCGICLLLALICAAKKT